MYLADLARNAAAQSKNSRFHLVFGEFRKIVCWHPSLRRILNITKAKPILR